MVALTVTLHLLSGRDLDSNPSPVRYGLSVSRGSSVNDVIDVLGEVAGLEEERLRYLR